VGGAWKHPYSNRLSSPFHWVFATAARASVANIAAMNGDLLFTFDMTLRAAEATKADAALLCEKSCVPFLYLVLPTGIGRDGAQGLLELRPGLPSGSAEICPPEVLDLGLLQRAI
jgi:hypothetical protein